MPCPTFKRFPRSLDEAFGPHTSHDNVWFSLSCGHVVMGYKHGAIFDWEANIDHDCCGDATATKAMPVTPPDSYGIGLEVKT